MLHVPVRKTKTQAAKNRLRPMLQKKVERVAKAKRSSSYHIKRNPASSSCGKTLGKTPIQRYLKTKTTNSAKGEVEKFSR